MTTKSGRHRAAMMVGVPLAALCLILCTILFLRPSGPASRPSAGDVPAAVPRDAPVPKTSAAGSAPALPPHDAAFEGIKADANRGDPAAQRALALRYEACFSYSLGPQFTEASLARREKKNPADAAHIRRLRAHFASYCGAVDGGALIPPDAVDLWLEQAAKGGDLMAQVIIASEAITPPSAEARAALFARARDAKDPGVVFRLSNLAADAQGTTDDPALAPGLDSNAQRFAWRIAACRAGYDCSALSPVMAGLCVDSGFCGYDDYEQFVLALMIPPQNRAAFEERVRTIQSRYLSR